MGSDKIFNVGGSNFLGYIMKSEGPRIDPWGTQCFIASLFEKKF
jgi:hypothetical protein